MQKCRSGDISVQKRQAGVYIQLHNHVHLKTPLLTNMQQVSPEKEGQEAPLMGWLFGQGTVDLRSAALAELEQPEC